MKKIIYALMAFAALTFTACNKEIPILLTECPVIPYSPTPKAA